MFSNSLKYLIKALTFLASHSGNGKKYGLLEIASSTKVPAPYLGKLLNILTKDGIVSSSKGPKGGFYLSENNSRVKLGRVVFLIEGKDKYGKCLMGLEDCDFKNPCALHDLYTTLKFDFLTKMESVSLGDLSKPENEMKYD